MARLDLLYAPHKLRTLPVLPFLVLLLSKKNFFWINKKKIYRIIRILTKIKLSTEIGSDANIFSGLGMSINNNLLGFGGDHLTKPFSLAL